MIKEIITSAGKFEKSLIGQSVYVPGTAPQCNVETNNNPDNFTIKAQSWTVDNGGNGTVDYEVNINGKKYIHVVMNSQSVWVEKSQIGGVVKALYSRILSYFQRLEVAA
ncbi:hypothetical protein [uncultured Lactobacillus sp.]|uniref:hypothetical protein n=1 Tax=uncultured Lactobacillus sp. TaxID=153152 RepID=UPI00260283AD|nr:hypothetical protein [uncultured Lactobacillus sp.]